jgi:hypothetical protein
LGEVRNPVEGFKGEKRRKTIVEARKTPIRVERFRI